MSHHAYYFAGDAEKGIAAALSYAEMGLGLHTAQNPDISIQQFGLFSVEDARKISDMAYRAPIGGSQKIIVIAAPRIFEQAQNALLKIFEEPPAGVTLVLVIPSKGILLTTLRSRLLPLPLHADESKASDEGFTIDHLNSFTEEFISSDEKGRAKLIAKLVDQSKSDNEDMKQSARASAITFIEHLTRYGYAKRASVENDSSRQEITRFLSDLNRFMPLMHTRSAPLKLIFEHILLVFPAEY